MMSCEREREWEYRCFGILWRGLIILYRDERIRERFFNERISWKMKAWESINREMFNYINVIGDDDNNEAHFAISVNYREKKQRNLILYLCLHFREREINLIIRMYRITCIWLIFDLLFLATPLFFLSIDLFYGRYTIFISNILITSNIS